MPYPTLIERLLERFDKIPSPRAQMVKAGDHWLSISSAEVLRRIGGLANALNELGVKKGDRVGLFSGNRPEWHIADFAILGLGAVSVPVYFNESPERMAYILNHSGCKVVFAAGAVQAERLLAAREKLKTVEQVIVAGGVQDLAGGYAPFVSLIAAAGENEAREYSLRARETAGEQLATIIYTSGTTGEPKGVMLTHNNLSSNSVDSRTEMQLSPAHDLALSFLPLAHGYQPMTDYRL